MVWLGGSDNGMSEQQKPHTIINEIEREADQIIEQTWALLLATTLGANVSPGTITTMRIAFLASTAAINARMASVPPARHGALRHGLVMMAHKKVMAEANAKGTSCEAQLPG